MNEDKELEDAIEIIKNSYVMYTKHCLDDENTRLRQAIEVVLQALERYKRLAEANLKDSEEFKNNMCKHRCILKSELQELKESSIPKKKIKNEIEILKAQCGGNVFHIQQTLNAEIRLLQELLEDK